MHIDDYLKRKILEIPIEDIANKMGYSINKHTMLCPFHDDHHPSLHFHVKTNTYKCFSCGARGNSINLVMNGLNLSFPDACQWIAQSFGLPLPTQTRIIRPRKIKSSPSLKATGQRKESGYREPDVEILNWIINSAGLSNDAKRFLYDERKYKESVCNALKIGSISNSSKFVDALTRRFGLQRSLNSGIIIRTKCGTLIPFTNVPCLLFPFRDEKGIILNIQGRYIGDKPDQTRFFFIKGLKTGIFNLDNLVKEDYDTPIYISEGVTDGLALLSEGKQAVAIPGASGFKEEYAKYFRGRVLFMYPDHDDSGKNLFKDANEKLRIISNYVTELSYDESCKDYSDFYLKKQNGTPKNI